MPVIGLNFRSINARTNEKNVKKGVELKINSTPKIESMEKRKLDLTDGKEIVHIKFSFKTLYEPDLGEVVLEGDVFYQTENPDDIIKKWDDEKRIDDNVAVDIFNAIMRKSLAKVVYITDELRLPPPVSFPIVKTRDEA